MDSKKQRLAIAESLGWIGVRSHFERNGEMAFVNGSPHHIQLPDWLTNANAALGLCDALWRVTITKFDGGWRVLVISECGHEYEHTAPTFAEAVSGAYLKAKGLWREEGE